MLSGWRARKALQQIRQCALDGFPDYVEVDIKVTMGDPVAHTTHAAPRNLRMTGSEIRILIHDLGGCLANDDQAHHHRLLGAPVFQKRFFAQTLNKADRVSSGLPDVLQIMRLIVILAAPLPTLPHETLQATQPVSVSPH